MPTEEAYKDLLGSGRSAISLVEQVRDELGEQVDGSDESQGYDQWLSGLMLRLDVALEKMREVR